MDDLSPEELSLLGEMDDAISAQEPEPNPEPKGPPVDPKPAKRRRTTKAKPPKTPKPPAFLFPLFLAIVKEQHPHLKWVKRRFKDKTRTEDPEYLRGVIRHQASPFTAFVLSKALDAALLAH